MPINPLDTHHCYIHDVSGDSKFWRTHQEVEEHDFSGVTTCTSCRKKETPIIFKGRLFDGALPTAFCDDCKKMLGMK